MDYNMENLRLSCREIGIELSNQQLEQFARYYDYLVEKNKVMNLTSITEFDEVMEKHFFDSLTIVKAVEMGQIKSMADMGTGAGFPGIPLKIVFPHIQVLLIDSLKKRLNFLDEVIEMLELSEIETLHGRAEDVGKNPLYREKFDLCVSRAVANLSTLSEYCLPLVHKNGCFISYKSGEIQKEVKEAYKAVKILGGSKPEILSFTLPATESGRTLLKIKKEVPTPKKYPRKAGLPSKEPIK